METDSQRIQTHHSRFWHWLLFRWHLVEQLMPAFSHLHRWVIQLPLQAHTDEWETASDDPFCLAAVTVDSNLILPQGCQGRWTKGTVRRSAKSSPLKLVLMIPDAAYSLYRVLLSFPRTSLKGIYPEFQVIRGFSQ